MIQEITNTGTTVEECRPIPGQYQYPQPCPCCGRCPTCGRGGFPNVPNIGPQYYYLR
jgi:hypothetical protein